MSQINDLQRQAEPSPEMRRGAKATANHILGMIEKVGRGRPAAPEIVAFLLAWAARVRDEERGRLRVALAVVMDASSIQDAAEMYPAWSPAEREAWDTLRAIRGEAERDRPGVRGKE
jgi:hypothetical protein